MAITRKDIEHIAALARLDISGEHFDRLAEEMQSIVGMVDKLQELGADVQYTELNDGHMFPVSRAKLAKTVLGFLAAMNNTH